MTKFLRKLAIYLLISFGCVALVFASLLLLPNKYTKDSHEMNLVYSINRLKHLKEPKMVIIGEEDGAYYTKLFSKEQTYKSMLKILGY